ncbi:hypothetical protein [uncultured Roseibium sp.]|uniref:hypothetical protein n=1 Tax=uncultured Roseibium sp. TaxID=1936171 RepID=UPI002621A2AB|nr:hypothetical protein [uncultured Roseibium sp.]
MKYYHNEDYKIAMIVFAVLLDAFSEVVLRMNTTKFARRGIHCVLGQELGSE